MRYPDARWKNEGFLFSFKTHTFCFNVAEWLTHGLLVRCAVSLSFRFSLTRCSGNSLNSYIKSVNTVLFNLQNYFQKASSPLRGHPTRFKVHVLSQSAFHRDHRRMREALHARLWLDTSLKCVFISFTLLFPIVLLKMNVIEAQAKIKYLICAIVSKYW